MSVILDQEVRVVNTKEGQAFYNSSLPAALREAQAHAGEQGHVATMPELLHGRTVARFDNEIWTQWFTANSAEYVGKTAQGKPVVIVAHGIGPFTNPARIEQAYQEGLVNYAGKFTQEEFAGLLGSGVPSFGYDEFLKRTSILSTYAIVIDFEKAKGTTSDHQAIGNLYKNPLVIARAGGEAPAKAFLDKAAQKYQKYGQWHPFGNVDVEQSQGRLLFLGSNDDNGLNGDDFLNKRGRFVGVAPEAQASGREAPAPSLTAPSQIIAPKLDDILRVVGPYTASVNADALRKQLTTLYK
jgi:hypothetical protein